MSVTQTATLMRIFVDEDSRHDGRPLYMAIVDELLAMGLGGVTVLKGIEGYGSHRQVHSIRNVDLAANLPVLIEVAEAAEKVRTAIPRLRAIIPEGLITLEPIQMRLLSKPS